MHSEGSRFRCLTWRPIVEDYAPDGEESHSVCEFASADQYTEVVTVGQQWSWGMRPFHSVMDEEDYKPWSAAQRNAFLLACFVNSSAVELNYDDDSQLWNCITCSVPDFQVAAHTNSDGVKLDEHFPSCSCCSRSRH